jgi:hypothetical protein
LLGLGAAFAGGRAPERNVGAEGLSKFRRGVEAVGTRRTLMNRSLSGTRAAVALALCTLLPVAAFAAAATPSADDPTRAQLDAKVKAAAESRGPQVSIPFANHGGIVNWRAVDRDTLLIEGRGGKWYRAELLPGCFDLPFADRVGFRSNPGGDFDRFSSVYVRGQTCRVSSLTETAPPPKRAKKGGAKEADAKQDAPPAAAAQPAAQPPAKPVAP